MTIFKTNLGKKCIWIKIKDKYIDKKDNKINKLKKYF